MQIEITSKSPLLDSAGNLTHSGWSRQPLLDCNLENVSFYRGLIRPLQRYRIKEWDYYAIFSPNLFFSATIANLGYAGNIFVYTLDLATGDLHEESIVVPLGKGIRLPRNSDQGESYYKANDVLLSFSITGDKRVLSVDWAGFNNGKGIKADINLHCPQDLESMTIVIPIQDKRFYYNRKINCLPAEGIITYGDYVEELNRGQCLGSLDWGRGAWAYKSFWQWASASGYNQHGQTLGLNLGGGFGDTSAATENCFILDGKIHKLEKVTFEYDRTNFMKPWRFQDTEERLNLIFTPFKERIARTNLLIIDSEVHQLFGHYNGLVTKDNGEVLEISDLIGFAEEHHAKW